MDFISPTVIRDREHKENFHRCLEQQKMDPRPEITSEVTYKYLLERIERIKEEEQT